MAEPETPKPAQFHFLSCLQGVCNTLQEQLNDCGGLVLRELHGGGYRYSGLLLEIYAACLSSKPLSSQ
jgi:hypothetical protein